MVRRRTLGVPKQLSASSFLTDAAARTPIATERRMIKFMHTLGHDHSRRISELERSRKAYDFDQLNL
jgi:hypothetical protein